MKTRILKIVVFLVFLIIQTSPVFSQWGEGQINTRFSIPEIALIDIEPDQNKTINFNVLPASESGVSSSIQNVSNNTLWVNYSSAVSGINKKRSILAEIANGVSTEGITIFLEASAYSGNGKGQTGQPAGKISLSNLPKPIISGIGSCYTNDGINNGHLLTFSIEISDYSKIYSAGEKVFTVLYTISDN